MVRLSGTQSRKTITDANGNYQFDNVEPNGFYTVMPSRVNYNFTPVNRAFSQIAERTEAVARFQRACSWDRGRLARFSAGRRVLMNGSTADVLFALRACGGRDARAPSLLTVFDLFGIMAAEGESATNVWGQYWTRLPTHH